MLGVGSGRVLLFRVGSFFCNSSLERAASRQHVTLRSISRTPTTMVEGHQCHRVAHFHRKKLLGHSFKATSPNGRFIDGAAAIADKPLVRIEVHGKNLFYFFGDDTNAAEMVCLHFHFGMSGAFATHPLPGPEPKATTRLALTNEAQNIVAHLSAMTVQHGDLDFYATKAAALGEDPLREGANPEAVWNKVSSSKKPIGLLLMDQSVIAGVGNIYRAEILFKASIHPEQPGNTLPREAFDSIWAHSVALLRRGFETGSILTVDPEEAAVLGPPWTRRYIYNQARCGRCKGPVKTWDMASRTVYCCTACQPLVASAAAGAEGDLPQARKKAMAGAVQAVQFRSHCAPDDDGHVATPPSKLSVAELKKRLTAAGLPTNGRKAELIARLQSGVDQDSAHAATAVGVKEEPEPAAVLTPLPAQRKRAQRRGAGTDSRAGGTSDVVFPEVYAWGGEDVSGAGPSPGTIGVGHVATPLEAALEKAAAGEGRNVEHVALHEDDVMNEVGAGARKAKRLRGGKS